MIFKYYLAIILAYREYVSAALISMYSPNPCKGENVAIDIWLNIKPGEVNTFRDSMMKELTIPLADYCKYVINYMNERIECITRFLIKHYVFCVI
ncbi:hypothetical protein GJ496_000886 [Pomphorhynchus laevis]|nr:hypothetical protein GJ496_000886 [Pomphorhynchus laevis]